MKILDAIKTGLPFKRPTWKTWVDNNDDNFPVRTLDILANDWEVKEERKAFTESELREAFNAATYINAQTEMYGNRQCKSPMEVFLKKLGF